MFKLDTHARDDCQREIHSLDCFYRVKLEGVPVRPACRPAYIPLTILLTQKGAKNDREHDSLLTFFSDKDDRELDSLSTCDIQGLPLLIMQAHPADYHVIVFLCNYFLM